MYEEGARLRRRSTAGDGNAAFFSFMADQLPAGLVLNLGAGNTDSYRADHYCINIDHVRPLVTASDAFLVADVARLPLRDASFHGIIMKDVLEHVVDCLGVLAEARRVSMVGTVLVLTTPRAIPRAVWDDPTHIRGFSARALAQALALTGWSPLHAPRRVGSLPGAARLGIVPRLESIMSVPGLGHWFGTNWMVRAVAE